MLSFSCLAKASDSAQGRSREKDEHVCTHLRTPAETLLGTERLAVWPIHSLTSNYPVLLSFLSRGWREREVAGLCNSTHFQIQQFFT